MQNHHSNSDFNPLSGQALRLCLLGVLATIGGCGGGGGGGGGGPAPTYSVGGTISGLSSSGLVLANGTDTASPASGATTFRFGAMLVSGASYAATVKTQPTGETCTVKNGSGSVGSANVSSVQVACTINTYLLSGTVDGLTGTGLALLNGTENLPIAATAGNFAFAAILPYGTAYAVTVATQPAGQSCQVSNGSGSAGVTTAPVIVSCAGAQWTWLGGSQMAAAFGSYGTKGVASSTNVPGARAAEVTWVDGSGGLWMFGGYGNGNGGSGYLSDLWRYDTLAGQWTWKGGPSTVDSAGIYGTLGVPSTANSPGGRNYSVSWFDQQSGAVWVFGGIGYGSSSVAGTVYLNDLWKYNPQSGTWAWESGSNTGNASGVYGTLNTPLPSNVPGAREGAVAWLDATGKLWLFGGYGYDSAGAPAELNDLWSFDPRDPLNANWTWMGGSNLGFARGVYGSKGAPSTANAPGARRWPTAWVDASGSFWLFGGEGYSSVANEGLVALNDLWTYDPTGHTWTWVSGANAGDALGVYGTKSTPAMVNVPGARYRAVGWHDSAGSFWLYGGNGFGATGARASLNDLWRFNPGTAQWTWVSGSDATNSAGVYGTLGMAGPLNVPGARELSVTWVDTNNTLWLFGGYGRDSSGLTLQYLNDLWFIVPN